MTDKREPSLETTRPAPDAAPRQEASPRPAQRPGAPPAAQPAAAPNRAKGPPVEPEAFQRWLGIERLKVEMRRLEIESRKAETPAPRATHPALPVLYGLVLVAVLGLVAFITAQTLGLREEIAALRSAQTEIAGQLATMEAERASAPASPAPPPLAAAPAAPALATPAPTSAASPSADSALVPPVSGQPAAAESTQAAAPAAPALPGAGYTVRIFAPVNAVSQARMDGFTAPLKAAGFDVVVSDTGVVQTTSNSMSYFATTEEMANRVAGIIQKKHPAIAIEMRASPSIPPSARQIIILNLTEDAFN